MMKNQPPQPRGRPPSSPPLVTTSPATTASPASYLSSPLSSMLNTTHRTTSSTTTTTSRVYGRQAAAAAAPATITVEEAIRLYKRDGNAVAALEAFTSLDEQSVSQQGNSTVDTIMDTDNNSTTIDIPPYVPANERGFPVMWYWHNRTVLEHIIRSSKHCEENEKKGGESNDDDRDELDDSLSTMLLIQGISADASTVNTATTNLRSNAESMIGRRYDCLVIVYNKCLYDYAKGKYREAKSGALLPFTMATQSIKVDSNGLLDIINLDGRAITPFSAKDVATAESLDKKNTAASLGFLFMTTRLAFLLMDCHLALHCGSGMGRLGPIVMKDKSCDNSDFTIKMEDIILWIEKNPLFLTSRLGKSLGIGVACGSLDQQYDWFQHDELKFRLHLYRSRILFAGSSSTRDDEEDGNDTNSRLRISRKELKNAMDIYQNKLAILNEEEIVGKAEDSRRGKTLKHDSAVGSIGCGQQDLSETTSVTSMAGGSFVSASDALVSEAKGGGGWARATFEGIPTKNFAQQQPQSSDPQAVLSPLTVKVKTANANLQSQHESVLYLKANLEYLRGNTSKSLKLCAEARSAGKNIRFVRDNDKDDDGEFYSGAPQDIKHMMSSMELESCDTKTPLDLDSEARRKAAYRDAIYYNNLALLHHSAGKIYLALQYYSYALTYMQKSLDGLCPTASTSRSCWSNGVVFPDLRSDILSNKSLCAFQAQEFHTAYTCMAQCVKLSPFVFGKRSLCWLRLAQSCIGVHTKLQPMTETKNEEDDDVSFQSIELCSDKDLGILATHPLKRATFCLFMALHLCAGNLTVDSKTISTDAIPSLKEGCVDTDMHCYGMALVSLMYTKVQSGENKGALEIKDKIDNSGISIPSHLRSLTDMYFHRASAKI